MPSLGAPLAQPAPKRLPLQRQVLAKEILLRKIRPEQRAEEKQAWPGREQRPRELAPQPPALWFLPVARPIPPRGRPLRSHPLAVPRPREWIRFPGSAR